jgi:hypothetical protein
MGRPLNHKYFGDLNIYASGVDLGGEGIASVASVTGLSGMSAGGPYTILAADIGAPDIAGGVRPVLTFTATGATAGTVTVVSAGAGYTSAPTVTVRGSLAGGSGTATPTVTLTSGAAARDNAILCTAYIPVSGAAGYISGSGGAGARTNSDIVRQVGSRSYVVQSSDGIGRCTLKATAASAAGEMNIIATDSGSNTYFVTKLTNRKAYLTRGTLSSTWQFATGDIAAWTLGSAVANTTVTITNG